jgi:hypothetical protein
MQNVSPEDQQQLARALEALNQRPADASINTRLLQPALINVVGVDVLTTAVESLADEIR